MSGFTKLNLVEDVENSAEKFGMGDVLAAHFARDDLGATEFGLSLQRLKPNRRLPFGHHHETQEEVYVALRRRWFAPAGWPRRGGAHGRGRLGNC